MIAISETGSSMFRFHHDTTLLYIVATSSVTMVASPGGIYCAPSLVVVWLVKFKRAVVLSFEEFK